MSVDITIRVPDELGRQLERFRDRLPEVLERGLRELLAETDANRGDANGIIEVLASRPTPEQVLAIRPSRGTQSRVSELLRRGKDGELSRAEEAELEKYFVLEHLVRLAKARALEELARGG
jgi:hypothetical protein